MRYNLVQWTLSYYSPGVNNFCNVLMLMACLKVDVYLCVRRATLSVCLCLLQTRTCCFLRAIYLCSLFLCNNAVICCNSLFVNDNQYTSHCQNYYVLCCLRTLNALFVSNNLPFLCPFIIRKPRWRKGAKAKRAGNCHISWEFMVVPLFVIHILKLIGVDSHW